MRLPWWWKIRGQHKYGALFVCPNCNAAVKIRAKLGRNEYVRIFLLTAFFITAILWRDVSKGELILGHIDSAGILRCVDWKYPYLLLLLLVVGHTIHFARSGEFTVELESNIKRYTTFNYLAIAVVCSMALFVTLMGLYIYMLGEWRLLALALAVDVAVVVFARKEREKLKRLERGQMIRI